MRYNSPVDKVVYEGQRAGNSVKCGLRDLTVKISVQGPINPLFGRLPHSGGATILTQEHYIYKEPRQTGEADGVKPV